MSRALALAASLVAALAVAMVFDLIGLTRITSPPLLVGVAFVLGGIEAAAWRRLVRRAWTWHAPFAGAVAAAVAATVVTRIPGGWLDLGPIAAGPPEELPLVVLPLTTLLASGVLFRE